jgi:signal transduction histidine kinase
MVHGLASDPAPGEASPMTAVETPRAPADAAGVDRNGPFIPAPSRSRKAMNWLFADKERMFWALQIAGWAGFLFLHFFSVASMLEGDAPRRFAYSVVQSMIGFLTTAILLRPMFRFARRQEPVALLSIALVSTVATAVAMSAIKLQAFIRFFGDRWVRERMEMMGTENVVFLILPDIPPNLFLLLSWAGFYFGINYYLTLRAETERALVAARLADQAQLKMLRYQLNPHFLFNTLNAISTLVLEKNGAAANEMLMRLSAFLRYGLDNDPLMKTTLAEELRALQLYLDIEQSRFGDRLTVERDVAADALPALVPSLILQPAVENAIKYAISRMESDGKISIVARKDGQMLSLEVCDNGPNAPQDPERLLEGAKSGVGLVNMRERLAHLYGERQSFRLSRMDGGGLCVSMRFPHETRSDRRE